MIVIIIIIIIIITTIIIILLLIVRLSREINKIIRHGVFLIKIFISKPVISHENACGN